MIRLILFAGIVCCIAYLSPTRERDDVASQVGEALSGVETLAAVASSSLVSSRLASSRLVSSGFGQRVIAEAISRPPAPVAEPRVDHLANPPTRPYK